ncbi:MAG: 16S rRNA (uracil(1498)-N(3))-methyltransferase [Pirellulales bacterium]|nr:16S rRNA (uracil(1498)-N(3))-methyltransferase [Pirellulales bacterium]
MSERFFVETPIRGDRATLTGPEAHHLIHVMRARQGDAVVLFDGSGWEFSAAVTDLGRGSVDLHVVARREVDRELSREIVLAVALPKGQRQKYLVEKAVELGVIRLVPLRTKRAVAQPDRTALERLRRTVIEASKQCGRNRLMEIAPPQDWPDFIEATRNESCRLLAHLAPGESPEANSQSPGDKVILAVGPEGGWTDEEAALAVAAGWRTVSLGRRVLRVETAALVLVTWMTKN